MAGPKYDTILKTIAGEAPNEFFAWLAQIVGFGAASIENSALPTELPTAPRSADLIWLIRAALERAILHLELQLEPDETMHERLLGYQARLIELYHLPVISVVIWLKKTTTLPASPAVWVWRGQECNRCVFFSIKLWEQPQAAILNTSNPSLWPLAGLMAKATGKSVVQVGHKIADAPIPPSAKSDLVGYLWALAGVPVPAKVVQAAFRRHPHAERTLETVQYRAGTHRGRAQGRRQGRRPSGNTSHLREACWQAR